MLTNNSLKSDIEQEFIMKQLDEHTFSIYFGEGIEVEIDNTATPIVTNTKTEEQNNYRFFYR